MNQMNGNPNDQPHYFFKQEGQEKGPYTREQLQKMYENGMITADVTVSRKGSEESMKIMEFIEQSKAVKRSIYSTNVFLWLFAGCAVGVAASYFFRPTFLGIGPSFGNWFTYSLQGEYGATIFICGAVGAFLGFVFGLLLGNKDIGPNN